MYMCTCIFICVCMLKAQGKAFPLHCDVTHSLGDSVRLDRRCAYGLKDKEGYRVISIEIFGLYLLRHKGCRRSRSLDRVCRARRMDGVTPYGEA